MSDRDTLQDPRHTVLDQAILAEAASWLLSLQEGPLQPEQQREFERWKQLSDEHRRAWKRAQRLLDRFEALPPELAKPTLGRPANPGRRTLVGSLALLLGAVPLGAWLWRALLSPRAGNAEYVTARGEQRELLLEDGTRVVLNTDTTLVVAFSETLRLLHLRHGELYISSGADRRPSPRPLQVRTDQGLLQALGTRFGVRRFDDETLLAVYEGAVRVQPDQAVPSVINAGQQVRFNRHRLGPRERASEAALAWRDGLLLADDMSLQQWAGELMRYSRETITYSPALEHLDISGTFPVDDLPLALGMLAQTYGLQVQNQGGQWSISR